MTGPKETTRARCVPRAMNGHCWVLFSFLCSFHSALVTEVKAIEMTTRGEWSMVVLLWSAYNLYRTWPLEKLLWILQNGTSKWLPLELQLNGMEDTFWTQKGLQFTTIFANDFSFQKEQSGPQKRPNAQPKPNNVFFAVPTSSRPLLEILFGCN